MKPFYFLLILLFSCSQVKHQESFSEISSHSEKALVYLYWPKNSDHESTHNPLISINNKELGRIKYQGHFVRLVNPGAIKIEVYRYKFIFKLKHLVEPLKFEARKGRVYYIAFAPYQNKTLLRIVPKDLALKQLKQTKVLMID